MGGRGRRAVCEERVSETRAEDMSHDPSYQEEINSLMLFTAQCLSELRDYSKVSILGQTLEQSSTQR